MLRDLAPYARLAADALGCRALSLGLPATRNPAYPAQQRSAMLIMSGRRPAGVKLVGIGAGPATRSCPHREGSASAGCPRCGAAKSRARDFDAAAGKTAALGNAIDLLNGTRDDAYAHTHAAMYYTDLGNWRRRAAAPREEILGESGIRARPPR